MVKFMTAAARENLAIKVSRYSIVVNIFLTAIKLLAGVLGSSAAMISDAVHSLSDVFSTVIVIIGVKFAGKDADASHPYGHERLECVAGIILAIILLATGAGIGYTGVVAILAADGGAVLVPEGIALTAAIISIAFKEAMYWYTRKVALQIESTALMADAWHHRSDALSSVGSFLGILGARLGYPVLDPLAAIIISLLVVKAAVEIFITAVRKLTDEGCDEETVANIRRIILSETAVERIDWLSTRVFADRIYVDVEIAVSPHRSFVEAHDISHRVHDSLEAQLPKIKHAMVHANPADDYEIAST